MTQTPDAHPSRPPVAGIVWDIVLNAVIPVILYKLSKRYVSPSEFTALLVATPFPFGKSIFDLARRGRWTRFRLWFCWRSALVALFFGGSPRLLLIRESGQSGDRGRDGDRGREGDQGWVGQTGDEGQRGQAAPCPAGEHRFTKPDSGVVICVRD